MYLRPALIFANLPVINVFEAKRVSIGTTVELGWPDAWRKPLILVMEKSGNVHEHIFYQGIPTYRVDNLDSGIACSKYLLMPRLPKVDLVFDGLDSAGNGKLVPFTRRRDF